MFLTNLLHNIAGFFSTPAVKKVENSAANLLPVALPIVQAIASAVPNRTVIEIAKIYTKYAIPFSQELATLSPDTALRDLAVKILQANHVSEGAISMLNLVVEMAVNILKAQAK